MPIILEFDQSLFLEGPAGTGKTTAAVSYVTKLINSGISPHSILVVLSHQPLVQVYQSLLHNAGIDELPDMFTFPDFVLHSLRIFWSQMSKWESEPAFIGADLSRYYIARFIEPYMQSGVFQNIRLSKSRLVSQIFDHYQQAGSNGLTLEEAEEKAVRGWSNIHSSRRKIYQAVSAVLHQYRAFCLSNQLLDNVSQVDLFSHQLLDILPFDDYFASQYQYLIVDNIEEMPAVGHDFIFWCLERLPQSLIIHDWDGGFRASAGADSANALQLRDIARVTTVFNNYIDLSPQMIALIEGIKPILSADKTHPETSVPQQSSAWEWISCSDYPEMVRLCARAVQKLLERKSVKPNDIAIIAPYLTDSLRFALQSEFEDLGIPVLSDRPSYPLKNEPLIKAVLVLLNIVLPIGAAPSPDEVAQMLHLFINDLDPLRASLLTQVAYQGRLLSFQGLPQSTQLRLGSELGQYYENLWIWAYENAQLLPQISLAEFLQRFLTEVLSQQGFVGHNRPDKLNIFQKMIRACQDFQEPGFKSPDADFTTLNQEFIHVMKEGLITDEGNITLTDTQAASMSSIYTYLIQGKPAVYQFWLDIQHPAWWKLSSQPITRPHTLRRSFTGEWTDEIEEQIQQQEFHNMILGLLRRCKTKVYAFGLQSSNTPAEQNSLLSLMTALHEAVL